MEDFMKRSLSALAALGLAVAIGATASSSASAQGRERIKAGTLTCDISAGLGLIIGSQRQVTCMFTPAQPGPREVYVGVISKFGLDLGATAGGQMAWSVYAPTTLRFGALAGRYGGASAQATVGVGAGVNVLYGGSDRTVSLQPLSVEGQTGLNVAAGVMELTLNPAR
jgi:hypothetical protein